MGREWDVSGIFEEEHHVRPDISNEISWGDLDLRIDFPRCNVFQAHHPKYFIFWHRRISVILFQKICSKGMLKVFERLL